MVKSAPTLTTRKVDCDMKFQGFDEELKSFNNGKVMELARQKYESILANREKILEAFIAETGYLPSEVEQVEQRLDESGNPHTISQWFVRKRQNTDTNSPKVDKK